MSEASTQITLIGTKLASIGMDRDCDGQFFEPGNQDVLPAVKLRGSGGVGRFGAGRRHVGRGIARQCPGTGP